MHPSNLVEQLPQVGDRIGQQFRIVRTIGKGAFGIVFEAHQEALQRHVALKMLLPRDNEPPEQLFERFKREAQLACSLTSEHTAIIYAFGIHQSGGNGIPYIAMELLDGEDLAHYLWRHKGKVPIGPALNILRQALASTAEAHDKGIVHRDIKPDNLYLVPSPHGAVTKVLDFGIATALGSHPDSRRAGMGSPYYTPPEILSGRNGAVTRTIDVYALGCVAWQLLGGRPPYEGNTYTEIAYAHMMQGIPALTSEALDDPALDRLKMTITRAMAKDPAERFPDARAFLRALEDALEGTNIHCHPLRRAADAPLRARYQALAPQACPFDEDGAEFSIFAQPTLDGPPGPTPTPTEDFPIPFQTTAATSSHNKLLLTTAGLVFGLCVAAGYLLGSSVSNSIVEPAAHTATIHSDPSGAEVHLNNMHVGQTPFQITQHNGDPIAVRVHSDGYEVWDSHVNLTHSTWIVVQLRPEASKKRWGQENGEHGGYEVAQTWW